MRRFLHSAAIGAAALAAFLTEAQAQAGSTFRPSLLADQPPSEEQRAANAEKAVLLNFIGMIGDNSAISLVNTVQDFYTQGYRRFHLFMTSEGGDVRAAMFAYETLKAMPITLSATAVGPIDSAAVHLYCAASERYAAPRVTFMFHPMYNQRNISTRSTSSIDVMNAAYKGWSDDVFSACFGGMPKEWDIDREDYRAEFGEARKIGLVNADGDVYATLGDVARAWSGVFFGVVEITGR